MASTFREEISLLELTTDCRVITEAAPPYKIAHVNQAWCETVGYTTAELIGNTCKLLQGAETCKQTMKARHNPGGVELAREPTDFPAVSPHPRPFGGAQCHHIRLCSAVAPHICDETVSSDHARAPVCADTS